LRKLARSPKRAWSGPSRIERDVALTANPFYALDGARPGVRLASIASGLKLGKPLRIGANRWYLVPSGPSNGVLKVRGGIVREVGIADKRLTAGRAKQLRFLTSL
jgi:hypothetical protein